MQNKLLILLLTLFITGVLSSSKRDCKDHASCRECIHDPNLCAWCADAGHKGDRCQPVSRAEGWCKDHLQNPNSSSIAELKLNFSSGSTITQLKPQSYRIKLRPGQEAEFNFSYKGAKDYPVDLYFLLDGSTSMMKPRKNTAEQSKQIYESIKNKTENVYLGMGTFIDKNALPFAKLLDKKLAYSYKHGLNMTKDYTEFQNAVESIPTNGTNIDNPEGGMDALAQAIVCPNTTRWREGSRKIIIMMTNAPFHLAGDGRSAGIFKPYDGNCYTVNGIYTKELDMDYPSVSMINKLARENQVIVIFLVQNQIINAYENLGSLIKQSKTAAYDQPNNNITNILKTIYEDITKTIDLSWNVRSGRKKNFKVSFDPNCTEEATSLNTTTKTNCTIRLGEEYYFNGKVKLLKYDADFDHTVIDITMKGIHEKVELHIDFIEACDCESNVTAESEYCNNEKLVCGKCECSNMTYGIDCACKLNQTNSPDEAMCIDPETPEETRQCHGSGTCLCGICVCNDDFTGKYCQCRQICEKGLNDAVCSGKAHGECQCDGTCKCNDNRMGSACQCDKEVSWSCMVNDKLCNNRGNCTCGISGGVCQCNDKPLWDKRDTWDGTCVVLPCKNDPDKCHQRQCNYLDSLAICFLENQENSECNTTDGVKYEIVEELPEEQALKESEWALCPKVRVDAGCYSPYAYKYDDEEYRILLMLQKKRDCNKMYYNTAAALLGSILLIGILTMVGWKLINDYRDRKEFDRFVKDHKNDGAAKCENPLYERPTTMISNPAFRKRSINRY